RAIAFREPRERVRHLLARGDVHVQVGVLDEALDRVDDVPPGALDPLHRAEQVPEPEAEPRVVLLRLVVDNPVERHIVLVRLEDLLHGLAAHDARVDQVLQKPAVVLLEPLERPLEPLAALALLEFLDDPIGILRTDPGRAVSGLQFLGTPGGLVVAGVRQIVHDWIYDLTERCAGPTGLTEYQDDVLTERRVGPADRPEDQDAVPGEDLGRARRAADQARERCRVLLDVRGPVGAGQLLDDVADGLDVVDDVGADPAPAIADPEVPLFLARADLGADARLWARLAVEAPVALHLLEERLERREIALEALLDVGE